MAGANGRQLHRAPRATEMIYHEHSKMFFSNLVTGDAAVANSEIAWP